MPKQKMKLTCYVAPAFHRALRLEALQRSLSLGDLISETFATRSGNREPAPVTEEPPPDTTTPPFRPRAPIGSTVTPSGKPR